MPLFDKRHIGPLFLDMGKLAAGGLGNPKAHREIVQVGRQIRHAAFEADDQFPTVAFDALIDALAPGFSSEIVMPGIKSLYGNGIGGFSPYYYYGALAAALQPKTSFEIGTFLGVSALTLALNTPDDSVIFTVDLPDQFEQSDISTLTSGDKTLVERANVRVGRAFLEHVLSRKVHQIRCNTTALDVGNFTSSIDFLIIDGGHSYELVKNDTEKCLPYLSEKGLAIWDDYSWIFPGITRYLSELNKTISLFRIKDSQYVVHSLRLGALSASA